MKWYLICNSNYKILFQWLGYYGSNGKHIYQLHFKTQPKKPNGCVENREMRGDQTNFSGELNDDLDIEYLLDESANADDNIFDEYCDDGETKHHR